LQTLIPLHEKPVSPPPSPYLVLFLAIASLTRLALALHQAIVRRLHTRQPTG
jgi:hypothetical protein